jgi:hypothetical protein
MGDNPSQACRSIWLPFKLQMSLSIATCSQSRQEFTRVMVDSVRLRSRMWFMMHLSCCRWGGRKRNRGDQESGRAVGKERTCRIKPGAVEVVQRNRGHTEWAEEDARNDLVPFDAYLQEASKRVRCAAEVLYDGKDMYNTLFKTKAAPSQATIPESAKNNGTTQFPTEATFAEGCVNCLELNGLALLIYG